MTMTVKELFNACDVGDVSSHIIRIEYSYFDGLPNDVDKIKNKIKKNIERNFRKARKIKSIPHPNETVYVKHIILNNNDSYYDVFTMRDGDDEKYAMELDSWGDILGRNVHIDDDEKISKEILAAEIFYNMAFFGYSYWKNKITTYFLRKSLDRQVKKLEKDLGCS